MAETVQETKPPEPPPKPPEVPRPTDSRPVADDQGTDRTDSQASAHRQAEAASKSEYANATSLESGSRASNDTPESVGPRSIAEGRDGLRPMPELQKELDSHQEGKAARDNSEMNQVTDRPHVETTTSKAIGEQATEFNRTTQAAAEQYAEAEGNGRVSVDDVKSNPAIPAVETADQVSAVTGVPKHVSDHSSAPGSATTAAENEPVHDLAMTDREVEPSDILLRREQSESVTSGDVQPTESRVADQEHSGTAVEDRALFEAVDTNSAETNVSLVEESGDSWPGALPQVHDGVEPLDSAGVERTDRRLDVDEVQGHARSVQNHFDGDASSSPLDRANPASVDRAVEFGEVTDAGRSTFLDSDDRVRVNVQRTPSEPGHHDVVVHGSAIDFGRTSDAWEKRENFDHRTLANMIRHDPTYAGEPVRLLTCRAGATSNGAAQNLSNQLGVNVLAPTDTLWAFPTGRLVIGPDAVTNTGTWRNFQPGGNRDQRV